MKAAVAGAIFLLSVVFLLTSIVAFAILQTQKSAILAVAAIFFTLFIWVVTLFVRKNASCPLCHGTPYFNSRAHKHEKATKLPFVNYGISNLLRTIVNQTFRCMYCGQPFDLLKPVTNPLGSQPSNEKKRSRKIRRRKKSQ